MEHEKPLEKLANIPTEAERLLGHLGLVNALTEPYNVPERIDEWWAVEPYENPSIERGNN